MCKLPKWYKKDPGLWNSALIIAILIFLGSWASSEASYADKTITEGYYGSVRFKTVETPVKGQKGVTLERGYIGTDYYRVTRKQLPDGTQTVRGWRGGKYINTKIKESKHVE